MLLDRKSEKFIMYKKYLGNHDIKCNILEHLVHNLHCINNNEFKSSFSLLKDYKLNMIMYNNSKSTFNKISLNNFTLKDFIKHIYLSNNVILTYHLYDGLEPLSSYDERCVLYDIKNHVRHPLKSIENTLNCLVQYYIGKQLRRFEANNNTLNCDHCFWLIEEYKKYFNGFNKRDNSKEDYENFYNMKLKYFLKLLKDLNLFFGYIKNDKSIINNYFKSYEELCY